jgi:hypothetical protein
MERWLSRLAGRGDDHPFEQKHALFARGRCPWECENPLYLF